MAVRRLLTSLAVVGCVCAVAGSTATAAGEEIVIESPALIPASPQFGIDPAVAFSTSGQLLLNTTCLPLLEYDEVTGELGPEGAAAMPTVSPDGRTFTFTVAAGHEFSDASEEPVTPESYKRAFERASSPDMAASIQPLLLPFRLSVAEIVGGQAFIDDAAGSILGIQTTTDSISIELVSARPGYLRDTIPFFCATPSTAPPGFTSTPIASAGPYHVTSASASEIVLERNPNYGGSRIQNLGRIRWAPHGSPLAEDYVADAPLSYVAPAGALDVASPTVAVERLALNTSRAPFDDIDVRRAAAFALNRTALSTTHGLLEPTDQFLAPLMPGFQDADVYPLDGSGADDATTLLGGATPSVRLCHTNAPANRVAMATEIEEQLEAVGFVVNRQAFPAGQFFGSILPNPANCELGLLTLVPGTLEPSTLLENSFHGDFFPPTGTNVSFFDDPGFNALFDAAEIITPDAARFAEYGEIDAELAFAAPAVAIGVRLRRDVFSDRIGCRFLSQVLWGYAVNRLCIEVDGTAPPGGTVSTGDEASPAAPLQTGVTVPSGGDVTITQGVTTTEVPPEFKLLEQRLDISAPAQTAANPLVLTFELDASVLAGPPALTIDDVVPYRNGAPVLDCTGAGATPDPCVASRTTQGDGDGEIVVRSSQASIWEFGERYDPAEASAALQALAAQPGPLRAKARDALRKVQAGIAKLARARPDRQGALGEFEGAVGDLEAALASNPSASAQLTAIMVEIAGTARQVALAARQQALDRGGNAAKIAEATAAIAEGDARWASDRFKEAVAKYKDAVAKAEGA